MKINQYFAGHLFEIFKIIFQGTTGQILIKLCMKHQRTKPFVISENYDSRLTLTYFTARSNLKIMLLNGKM